MNAFGEKLDLNGLHLTHRTMRGTTFAGCAGYGSEHQKWSLTILSRAPVDPIYATSYQIYDLHATLAIVKKVLEPLSLE